MTLGPVEYLVMSHDRDTGLTHTSETAEAGSW